MIDYLYWHYIERLYFLLILTRNLTLFPLYFFSVPHHMVTLFSSWKRQYIQKGRGFSFGNIFSVISFNIISRILGALMRTVLIVTGIILVPVFALFGCTLVLGWILIPGFSYGIYVSEHNPKEILRRALALYSHNPTHLLIYLIKSPMGQFIFKKLEMDPHALLKELYTCNLTVTLTDAHFTNTGEAFSQLSTSHPLFKQYIDHYQITPDHIQAVGTWFEKNYQYKTPPLICEFSALRGLKGIGAEWSYGYTPTLDKFSKDMTQIPTSFPLLIGREKELRLIEQGLAKSTGNCVLLVGEPGTARHQTIETLAFRILGGRSHHNLSHKRVLLLDMNSILSGHESISDAKSFFLELLSEADYAGNIILVIDAIEEYLNPESKSINLSDVISTLSSRKLGLIALTTEEKYRDIILPQKGLDANFEIVTISPPNEDTLLTELEVSVVPILEGKYHILITYLGLLRALEASNQYMTSGEFPDKAIRLLESSCQKAVSDHSISLTRGHIDKVIEEKLHVSIGTLENGEKEKLLHLEELMRLKVIDQEVAISALANTLRRSRLNIGDTKKPIGTFLFLGPTGVGKTETAKALASIYFQSEGSFARFDMSQYQNEEGMTRLIGSKSLNKPGELTTLLIEHPASVILLDELEKADTSTLNLLLTLIDEGYITDYSGKKVSAQNSIIIATSNAGGEFIREAITKGISKDELSEKTMEYILSKGIFSPEFINRFTSIIVFTPLSEGSLREVANHKLRELNTRLVQKNIQIDITPRLLTSLANLGYHPEFGARNMERTITEIVENQVAKRLLESDFKKGEIIQISI